MSSSLRAQAEALKSAPVDRSRIGALIAGLDDEQAAAVRDLVLGEPVLGHSAVAVVLNENFGDDCLQFSKDNVADFRARRGVKL